MYNNVFSDNRAFYDIMSKIVVEPEKPQMTVLRCIACWFIKATRAQAHARATAPTHTHSRLRTNPRGRTCTHKYVYSLLFHNNAFVNTLHCNVIRTLRVLFILCVEVSCRPHADQILE